MSNNRSFAKMFRFIGILFMGLTAGFTLLGGVGTTCVAVAPKNYDSMKALAPFQWLYGLFVLVGVALGIAGIRATIQLIKGAPQSYRSAMIVLLSGTAVGIFHTAVSRMLRGKSMPVDAVVYTTVLTLIIFLIFRIPSIWEIVDFSKGNAQSNRPAGGAAAILLGLLALTIQYTMGSTHTWNGINYADAFNLSMTVIGLACLALGFGIFILQVLQNFRIRRQLFQEKALKGF